MRRPRYNIRAMITLIPGLDQEGSSLTGEEPQGYEYEKKPEWKVIEEGGVLSIPVECGGAHDGESCYSDSSFPELQIIFCPECLENGVVFQEDINDMSLLQMKSLKPIKTFDLRLEAWFFQIASRWFMSGLDTIDGRSHLLTLSTRCLSHQSLLHIGYSKSAWSLGGTSTTSRLWTGR